MESGERKILTQIYNHTYPVLWLLVVASINTPKTCADLCRCPREIRVSESKHYTAKYHLEQTECEGTHGQTVHDIMVVHLMRKCWAF